MAVYLMQKNIILSRTVNFKPVPKKWPTKWTVVRRSISGLKNKEQPSEQQHIGGHQQKGKFVRIHRKWSWKAGAGWTILSVLDWWLLAAGGWLTWRGVFLRWTPLGICMIAAAQWHIHNRDLDRKGLPRTAASWQMKMYCSLPLRVMSRCWGWLADCRVPTPARPLVYGLYSTAFGVNIEEAASSDFKNYRSLAEFFTRSLKDDVRFIDPHSCVVSPCDGRVLHFGLATNSQIEQVKGVSYSLEEFLGPPTWCESECSGYVDKVKKKSPDSMLYQCIIYLAPGDYHRFHSPTEWKPEIRRHFSGELLSVSPKIAGWMPGLFCLNERALYVGKWMHGFFSFTAVGATNVGSVQIYIDEKLKTNKWVGLEVGTHRCREYDEVTLPEDTFLERGQLLGQFNMGSTIVLIFEAPHDFKFNLHTGQVVRMGQRIGCVNEENSEKSSKTKNSTKVL
ncbi:phosphatidylserine decarboxylase proenzyme, mitochondrial isoform X2 [Toxorhynchites rutilus septentrionalis]|uniref:phosphatidylserine decarboxylase proenzyme, mitochondrial isoform X2 n=1 Tax=Toxorhynchites rutilus septentrionalis TaxID=329112 RepID=UPI0024799FB8|nr:phosphatidylserine decarboxylase proenzyme, mitochondrial isoform X2 [Toxorhynchites rutilus septentrionalis]